MQKLNYFKIYIQTNKQYSVYLIEKSMKIMPKALLFCMGIDKSFAFLPFGEYNVMLMQFELYLFDTGRVIDDQSSFDCFIVN